VLADPAPEIVAAEGERVSPGVPVFQTGRRTHSVTAVDMGDVFGDAHQPRADAAVKVIGVDLEHADGRALEAAVCGPGQLETEHGVDEFTLRRDENPVSRVARQFEKTVEGGLEPGPALFGGGPGELAAVNVLDTHWPNLLDWNHPFIKIVSENLGSTSNIDKFKPSNSGKDSTNTFFSRC